MRPAREARNAASPARNANFGGSARGFPVSDRGKRQLIPSSHAIGAQRPALLAAIRRFLITCPGGMAAWACPDAVDIIRRLALRHHLLVADGPDV